MHLPIVVTRLLTEGDQEFLLSGKKRWIGVDEPQVMIVFKLVPVLLYELQEHGGLWRGGWRTIEAGVIRGFGFGCTIGGSVHCCGDFLAAPEGKFEGLVNETIQSRDDGVVSSICCLISLCGVLPFKNLRIRDRRDVIEQEGPARLSSVQC